MGCDKNELKNSEQEAAQDQTVSNHDLILPESKQYFIADVAGVEGMEKLNYQDNVFEFNLIKKYCSGLNILKVINGDDKIEVWFLTMTIEAGDYGHDGKIANTSIFWSSDLVSRTALNRESKEFTITEIKEIDGIRYAIGTFSLDFYVDSNNNVSGGNLGQTSQMTNGIFKLRI